MRQPVQEPFDAAGDDVANARFSADEPTTLAAVRAIAAAKDIEPTDMDPLHDSVDTKLLNELFQTPTIDRSDARYTFTHESCTVHVRQDGQITVVGAGNSE